MGIGAFFIVPDLAWFVYLNYVLVATIVINLIVLTFELAITHPTEDAKKTVDMILKGRYKMKFWLGVVLFGNFLPLVLIMFGVGLPITGVIALIGILITESIWVEAPQRIPLT